MKYLKAAAYAFFMLLLGLLVVSMLVGSAFGFVALGMWLRG